MGGNVKVQDSQDTAVTIPDIDRDSLNILPLSMIPIETPGLKRTRMIKNCRLESMVEVFEGQGIGSGQVKVEDLKMAFSHIAKADSSILKKLSKLPSYDVYSLRVLLRENDIPIGDYSYLQLSTRKQHELEGLMTTFTRPLIVHVYGDEHDIKSYADTFAMFRQHDVGKARENLQKMARKLGIMLDEVPKFLEDYGDIFLSVSYYQDCLNLIDQPLFEFQRSLKDIQTNRQLQEDMSLLKTCNRVGAAFEKLRHMLKKSFEAFSESSENMWTDVNAVQFQKFRAMIEDNHVTMGGVLCALSVKMTAWTEKFPSHEGGGPMKRAEFILTDMQQGLDEVIRLNVSGAVAT